MCCHENSLSHIIIMTQSFSHPFAMDRMLQILIGLCKTLTAQSGLSQLIKVCFEFKNILISNGATIAELMMMMMKGI